MALESSSSKATLLLLKERNVFDYRSAQVSTSDSIPKSFSRQLATEAGVVPDPPECSHPEPRDTVPGLLYIPDFITEGEESALVDRIDGANWSTELRRRVQQLWAGAMTTRKRPDQRVGVYWRAARMGARIGSAACTPKN